MWKHFQPGVGAFSVIVKGSLQALLFVCLDLRFSALSHFRRVSSLVLRQDCQELCRRVPWLQQQISGESFNTNFEEDKLLIIPYPQTETDITQSATPGSILNFIHNFTICLCVQNKGEKDTFTSHFAHCIRGGFSRLDEVGWWIVFLFLSKMGFLSGDWVSQEEFPSLWHLDSIGNYYLDSCEGYEVGTVCIQCSVWKFKAGLKVI